MDGVYDLIQVDDPSATASQVHQDVDPDSTPRIISNDDPTAAVVPCSQAIQIPGMDDGEVSVVSASTGGGKRGASTGSGKRGRQKAVADDKYEKKEARSSSAKRVRGEAGRQPGVQLKLAAKQNPKAQKSK